jgi:hypothetical protein
MLLDTIKRHDSQGMVKLACVESLRAKKQSIPPQIHSVPALVLLPNKQTLFGKHVFDYLLLPGSGKLLVSMTSNSSGNAKHDANATADGPNAGPIGEPFAYSMASSSSMSDNFAMIEQDVHPMHGLQDRAYTWTSLQDSFEKSASVHPDAPMQEETRTRKSLPDLDSLRAQREMELKESDINTTQLIPPAFTR